MMKYLKIILFIISFCSMALQAQTLEISDIYATVSDDQAKKDNIRDNNDDLCALIRINADGLEGMLFEGMVVKQVEVGKGEYLVYVPEGTKRLQYKQEEVLPGEIDITSFSIKIRKGHVYCVTMSKIRENHNTQMVVFNLHPASAKLIVDGEEIDHSPGYAQLTLPLGNHKYDVSCDGYKQIKGEFSSLEQDKEIKIVDVVLTPNIVDVAIDCNMHSANIYIDDVLKGFPGIINIPVGEHTIRLEKKGYKTIFDVINVEPQGNSFAYIMEESTSDAKITINAPTDLAVVYIDNRRVKEWRNGLSFPIKRGKHILLIKAPDRENHEEIIEITESSTIINAKMPLLPSPSVKVQTDSSSGSQNRSSNFYNPQMNNSNRVSGTSTSTTRPNNTGKVYINHWPKRR